ncbi:SCO6880 family protein [Georgenia sp. AZ-5]|uniref:SCO6880 family protein n=1 Tax=Georgenia sp. AZ-5 TaxID=3367526 RepID=UPI003754FE7B
MTTAPTAHESELGQVKFSRLSRRGVLLGLSGPQLTTVGVSAVALVAALITGGMTFAYVLPLLAMSAALVWVRVGGRPLVEWLPLAIGWGRRSATGQLEYHARIGKPRPAGTLALPGDAAALRQYVDVVTGAVYVHDPHTNTLTAILRVEHPAFVLLDPAEQQRRVAGWGRVLATVCRSGRLAAVQVIERTLPDSGKSLTDWWHVHGHDDGSWAARTYGQLVEHAGPAGDRHATTVSLALDLRAATQAIKAAGGAMRGAAAVLRQEIDTLTAALRAAALTPSTPLDPGDLALALRTAYDPAIAPALERHGNLGRDLATAGPVSLAESWGSLQSDSTHHAVLWISEWPRSAVMPGFLAPLTLSAGVRHTLSMLFTPMRADTAARDIRKKKTEYISDAAQRAKLGQLEDAAQSAEYGDVLQQEADLTAGHGILRVRGLIAVSAADSDELERAIAAIEQAAIQASCETRRLWGQQARAFAASALPLCRM